MGLPVRAARRQVDDYGDDNGLRGEILESVRRSRKPIL